MHTIWPEALIEPDSTSHGSNYKYGFYDVHQVDDSVKDTERPEVCEKPPEIQQTPRFTRTNKDLFALCFWMQKQAVNLRNYTEDADGLYKRFLHIYRESGIHIHDPALFSEALLQIYRSDCRRSLSERPVNRVKKMTLKNIYRNRRIYASHDNNLPGAIRDDIN
jgi:hypothetical protein